MTYQYSGKGLGLTEQSEGCCLTAYRKQVGGKLDVWTIGYGHTKGVCEGMTCTQEQADQWLLEDTAWAQAEVDRLVTVPITQGEFDALVDFVFNLGAGNFEHSTLLRLLNAGEYQAAAAEFEKWDKSGGVEVAGLLRRRAAEMEEFIS